MISKILLEWNKQCVYGFHLFCQELWCNVTEQFSIVVSLAAVFRKGAFWSSFGYFV